MSVYHPLRYLVLATIPLVVGCRDTSQLDSGRRSGPPTVITVNYPLAYFAEQIAGETAHVQFPVPADNDPDHWRPSENAIQEYQSADLILLNGSGYAAWTESVSLPNAQTVDTSKVFADRYLKLPDAIVHKHGPEGEHAHEGLATLTWLDPQQARQQAEAVYHALRRLMPERQEVLRAGWTELDEKLSALQQAVSELPPPSNKKMFASHPVYDYLGRYCGWNLKSMHWEPHETPSEDEWQKFAELHAQHQATIMLWEAPPTDATRERLASMGVECVAYYPCGNRPEEGDYLSVMQENVNRLRAALEKQSAPPEN